MTLSQFTLENVDICGDSSPASLNGTPPGDLDLTPALYVVDEVVEVDLGVPAGGFEDFYDAVTLLFACVAGYHPGFRLFEIGICLHLEENYSSFIEALHCACIS